MGRAEPITRIKPLIPPDADRSYIVRRSIDAMDNTRTDDLIRRNHELLAAAAQAWSAFMETVARIDHARERRSGRFVRFGTASGRPDAGEGRGCYLDNRRSGTSTPADHS